MLESFFNKVAGWQACNFIKSRLRHRFFRANIAKYLGKPILKDIGEQLILNFIAPSGEISALDT